MKLEPQVDFIGTSSSGRDVSKGMEGFNFEQKSIISHSTITDLITLCLLLFIVVYGPTGEKLQTRFPCE